MLLDAIHEQTLKPGERVREDEVSRMLGISRTPVRQALQKLQTRGLLRQAPGRGLVVAELDRQQVVELYAMRELLEGAAARLAAQHAGSSDIVAMRHVLQEFRRPLPTRAVWRASIACSMQRSMRPPTIGISASHSTISAIRLRCSGARRSPEGALEG